MKLLIGSLNYAPEPTATGFYTGVLAEELAAKGHNVNVVCSQPFYPKWQIFPGYSAWRWTRETLNGVDVRRCPVYIPPRMTTVRRLAHYISFMVTSFVPIVLQALREKPDVIVAIAPTIMTGIAVQVAAKLTGAKTWLHVQDFEVEAGFATGQLGSDGIAGRTAMWFSRRMMKSFDRVSSISSEMVRKLLTNDVKPENAVELRNWASIEKVSVQSASSYREEWGITTPYVALYSGSIAKKQGMTMLIDVARELEAANLVTLVICGNGPERAELEEMASGLRNIQFRDLQPFDRLGDLLAVASVHLLPQKRDAADLVLPSKLGNMLASGRPIVAGASIDTAIWREIEACGIAIEPEDAAAMAAAISSLVPDTARCTTLGREARKRAETHWAQAAIIDQFEAALSDLSRCT